MSNLERTDPEIYAAIENERRRQVEKIELIASENYTSAAVMEATGSVLTNKYAEGYPGRRYYGGCEWVDVAESLAIERAKALFGAAHANVQPHAGAQANMAAYAAVLKPGDTVLGLALDQGGHLTHGSPVNFSGKLYHFAAYGVRKDDEMLDYDELERLAKENRPKLIVAGATAYPRLPAPSTDRRRCRGAPYGRHGALRRSRRGGGAPDAGRLRADRHDHHAQDAPWSARRHDPVGR